MAHALLSHECHTLVNGLFRPRNDDVSFHDVPHGRCGRCFALENDIPRVVSFGDDANELVAIHHDHRSNVFLSHFRDGIEDSSIRVNRPYFAALLIKQLPDRRHLHPPSATCLGEILADRLRVPVERANPIKNIKVKDGVFDALPMDEVVPLLMLPVGLALRQA